jgi:hypothetical protein
MVLATSSLVVGAGRSEAACDFGRDTCKEGFVWREAFPGDHVCVSGAVRDDTAAENTLAPQRRSPNGGAYGPDTCLQGYVWREASPTDHVCVTGDRRTQAGEDNAQAETRRDPACASNRGAGVHNLGTSPGWNAGGDLVVEVTNWSKLSGSVDRVTAKLPGGAQPCEWSISQRIELGPTERRVVVVATRAAVLQCLRARAPMTPARLRTFRFLPIPRPDRPPLAAPSADALTIELVADDPRGPVSKSIKSWSMTRQIH